MALYEYEASGGFGVHGCAKTIKIPCFAFKYDLGSIVYICDKASLEGKLQKVCVAQVLINTNYYDQKVPLYIDKTARRWLEWELCTHAEALELALSWKTKQVSLIEAKIRNTCG